jgi:predicted ATPase
LSARKERGESKPPLYIKVKDLGDGIQKVVLTALWLEAMKPSLILWDDFEGSAHPTLIKVLLEWLSKKKWQVVMSTHSLDVLTSLLEVRPQDAHVLSLKKTNDDVLLHEDLSLTELEDVIETSQDPRKIVDSLKL